MKNQDKKKTILCILDGWGVAPDSSANAISIARKKNFDHLLENYPNSLLNASENEVGLPIGQFGNSEVGHMNIGAGRIILQDILRIGKSIETGELSKNTKIINLKKNCKRIHIVGLLSPGGVHGHEDHLFSLIDILDEPKNELFIHCILDGRDASPTGGVDSIKKLLNKIKDRKNITIASISGRYYAMDRDNRWERIELAYKAIIEGSLPAKSNDPINELMSSYSNSLTDEFFLPINFSNYSGVEKDDGFIITNYRTDRVREILSSIFEEGFSEFKRTKIQSFSEVLGMVQYSRKLRESIQPIFEPQTVSNTLGEILSNLKFKQLRIAETEKYAHVTYFFNGGKEEKLEGEDRVLIPSPRVITYDLKPEMAAFEMTTEVVKRVESQKYDFILINYANADMVGHTGIVSATVKAIETVDECVGKLLDVSEKENYNLILTSDHGNADNMLDEKKLPCTTHSTNLVPMIYVTKNKLELNNGCLADIAPTILDIMGIEKSKEMSGKSLIK